VTGLLRRVWEAYKADVPPAQRGPVRPARRTRGGGRRRDQAGGLIAGELAAASAGCPVWAYAVVFGTDARPFRMPAGSRADADLYADLGPALDRMGGPQSARFRRPQLWQRYGDCWYRVA
jgi:hypothetical protein